MEFDAFRLQDSGNERSHQVRAVFADSHYVTRIQHAVAAGNDHRPFRHPASGEDVGPGGGPVEVLVAMRVLPADHELGAVQESSARLVMHGLRTQAGALGKDVVLNGRYMGLYVHGLPQVQAQRFHGAFHLAVKGFVLRQGEEMLADGGEGVVGPLFFHYCLADGFVEEAFYLFAGTDNRYGGRLAKGDNSGQGALLEHK